MVSLGKASIDHGDDATKGPPDPFLPNRTTLTQKVPRELFKGERILGLPLILTGERDNYSPAAMGIIIPTTPTHISRCLSIIEPRL